MTIVTTSYAKRQAEIRSVRMAVFVEEQSVPIDLEMDDADKHCIHVLALDGQRPVGTGRIDFAKDGKVGRIAVLKSERRRGIGTLLMQTLEEAAHQRDCPQIWFHAQTSAIPFYEPLGYTAEGETFLEANIPHRTMRKQL